MPRNTVVFTGPADAEPMTFLLADTFTDSLAKLTGEEQKAVKTTAFDLQMNPANPGMSFHKLERGRDKNFWSVRVSLDLRIIVHRSESSLMLCYVGHHDEAYAWAERRKLERHPNTGAAQLVEVREMVKEVMVYLAFCIRPSASWWSGSTAVRRGSRARRERAKPSSPCTGPCGWRVRIRMRGSC